MKGDALYLLQDPPAQPRLSPAQIVALSDPFLT